MKNLHTFEEFLNENLNEASSESIHKKYRKVVEDLLRKIKLEINTEIPDGSNGVIRVIRPLLMSVNKAEDNDESLTKHMKWLKGITYINVHLDKNEKSGYSGSIETNYGKEDFSNVVLGYSTLKLSESVNEGKQFANKLDMEKVFGKKGIEIDVQDFTKDSGFFTTYDEVSKSELKTMIDKLGYSYEFRISDPIKSQESGTYITVSWNKK